MFTLKARFVFPIEGLPIEGGRLTIADGRIVRVGGPDAAFPVDLDLGNAAITPGFVNAHTHLELGPIAPSVADGPEDEIDWLRRVIESRRAGSTGSGLDACARNVAASIRSGTTALADTTTNGQSWEAVASAPLRGVVFAEVLGLGRPRGEQTLAAASDWLAGLGPIPSDARTRPGLSPHAPYSTARWLYDRAGASGLPLSTHLAELPEEAELLATRGGRLRRFLEDLGAWDETWEPAGPGTIDYLRSESARSADWIIAHGTSFGPDDFADLLPVPRRRRAIAYCPRTTARFGHGPHPYRTMLDRGVVVCLGTDSLASSPTLSVLDEARFLARDESVPGHLPLWMATLGGAWALRLDTRSGSLRAGKSADLAVVALPDRDEADPHDLLLRSEGPVVATMFRGEFVHGPFGSD